MNPRRRQRTWSRAPRGASSLTVARFILAGLAGLLVMIHAGELCAEEAPTRATSPVRGVSFGSGAESLESRDDLGSPLRYGGRAYPLMVGFSSRGPGIQHEAEATFSLAGLNTEVLRSAATHGDHHIVEPTHGTLAYRYVRRLGERRRANLWLGGQWTNLVFFRSHQYDPDQIGSVEVWDGFSSLDLVLRASSIIGLRHELTLSVSAPLGAFVIRPSYALRGDERIRMGEERSRAITDGELASWNTFQMGQLHAAYDFRFAERWRIEAGYRFIYYRYTIPMTTRALSNRLTVGLSWLF